MPQVIASSWAIVPHAGLDIQERNTQERSGGKKTPIVQTAILPTLHPVY
jgi:hypothetical protein